MSDNEKREVTRCPTNLSALPDLRTDFAVLFCIFRVPSLDVAHCAALRSTLQCPICVGTMDETDIAFWPCRCGYQVSDFDAIDLYVFSSASPSQICLWCYHNIIEKLNAKCPACRQPYDQQNAQAIALVCLLILRRCSSSVFDSVRCCPVQDSLRASELSDTLVNFDQKNKGGGNKDKNKHGDKKPPLTHQSSGGGGSSSSSAAHQVPASGDGARGGGSGSAPLAPGAAGYLHSHSNPYAHVTNMSSSAAQAAAAHQQIQHFNSQMTEREREREMARSGGASINNVRVLQRNLLYVVGLPPSLAREDILKKKEYFGRFGRIIKIAINRKQVNHSDPRASYSAYVTYKRAKDAAEAIKAINGAQMDGRTLRATHGMSCDFRTRSTHSLLPLASLVLLC
jgi:hypothetical protein